MQLSLSQTSFERNKFKHNKEPKIKNKGVNRANLVYSVATAPLSLVGSGILGQMKKIKLNDQETDNFAKAVDKGLKDSKLFDKGVRACTVEYVEKDSSSAIKNLLKSLKEGTIFTEENMEGTKEAVKEALSGPKECDIDAYNALKEEVGSIKFIKKLAKHFGTDMEHTKETVADILMSRYKSGSNACYLAHANKIITPDKVLRTSTFHEMGHALNANGGIILKSLQKMRPMQTLAPLVLLIALANKRKTTDKTNENDSKIQKTKDFVKRNAGKLTLFAYAPMVLEEGLATLRGENIARKLVKSGDLSKELFKKVKLTNAGGFASYALTAIGTALVTKLAIKVKDNIQAKYEQKIQNKKSMI